MRLVTENDLDSTAAFRAQVLTEIEGFRKAAEAGLEMSRLGVEIADSARDETDRLIFEVVQLKEELASLRREVVGLRQTRGGHAQS